MHVHAVRRVHAVTPKLVDPLDKKAPSSIVTYCECIIEYLYTVIMYINTL